MNTQPEALRLADVLDTTVDFQMRAREAAAELRRLHSLNNTLEVCASMQFDELNAVKALNAELLEAMKLITDVGDRAATEIARDAIAKAQGESDE